VSPFERSDSGIAETPGRDFPKGDIEMLWFFERKGERLNLETTYDNAAGEYVVNIRYPDGREEGQRFRSGATFRAWLMTFERTMETQRWTSRDGGPVILPYGWPDKTPLL
jgi:hypothetical protein